MAVFKCENKKCSEYGEERTEHFITYTYKGDKIICKQQFCPVCKKLRIEIKDPSKKGMPNIKVNSRIWKDN